MLLLLFIGLFVPFATFACEDDLERLTVRPKHLAKPAIDIDWGPRVTPPGMPNPKFLLNVVGTKQTHPIEADTITAIRATEFDPNQVLGNMAQKTLDAARSVNEPTVSIVHIAANERGELKFSTTNVLPKDHERQSMTELMNSFTTKGSEPGYEMAAMIIFVGNPRQNGFVTHADKTWLDDIITQLRANPGWEQFDGEHFQLINLSPSDSTFDGTIATTYKPNVHSKWFDPNPGRIIDENGNAIDFRLDWEN